MTADGNIPTISVTARCLPEAWEKAVLAVWRQGVEIKTEYDKPDDPPSKDATVIITVADPFAEPRIHKNFPGGPEELEAYRQEVCDGIHDHVGPGHQVSTGKDLLPTGGKRLGVHY